MNKDTKKASWTRPVPLAPPVTSSSPQSLPSSGGASAEAPVEDLTNPDKPPSSEGLGEGWTVQWSKSKESWYYMNKDTKKASWTRPEPAAAATKSSRRQKVEATLSKEAALAGAVSIALTWPDSGQASAGPQAAHERVEAKQRADRTRDLAVQALAGSSSQEASHRERCEADLRWLATVEGASSVVVTWPAEDVFSAQAASARYSLLTPRTGARAGQIASISSMMSAIEEQEDGSPPRTRPADEAQQAAEREKSQEDVAHEGEGAEGIAPPSEADAAHPSHQRGRSSLGRRSTPGKAEPRASRTPWGAKRQGKAPKALASPRGKAQAPGTAKV